MRCRIVLSIDGKRETGTCEVEGDSIFACAAHFAQGLPYAGFRLLHGKLEPVVQCGQGEKAWKAWYHITDGVHIGNFTVEHIDRKLI